MLVPRIGCGIQPDYAFASVLPVVSAGSETLDAGSGCSGAGGGVVAIVYPIQATMKRIPATATKAVICNVSNGQPYTNQP